MWRYLIFAISIVFAGGSCAATEGNGITDGGDITQMLVLTKLEGSPSAIGSEKVQILSLAMATSKLECTMIGASSK